MLELARILFKLTRNPVELNRILVKIQSDFLALVHISPEMLLIRPNCFFLCASDVIARNCIANRISVKIYRAAISEILSFFFHGYLFNTFTATIYSENFLRKPHYLCFRVIVQSRLGLFFHGYIYKEKCRCRKSARSVANVLSKIDNFE